MICVNVDFRRTLSHGARCVVMRRWSGSKTPRPEALRIHTFARDSRIPPFDPYLADDP